ncbi:MAG: hypothetical protein ACE5I1_21110 [bacterium]
MQKKHVATFAITFAIWLIFLLAGLPSNYYLEWAFLAQVWLCIFAFFLILPLTYLILRKIWAEDCFNSSLWLAFYASFPLMIYDYIFVGLIQGFGHAYIFSHWYLSIFYLIVWFEIPFAGWAMDRFGNRFSRQPIH